MKISPFVLLVAGTILSGVAALWIAKGILFTLITLFVAGLVIIVGAIVMGLVIQAREEKKK